MKKIPHVVLCTLIVAVVVLVAILLNVLPAAEDTAADDGESASYTDVAPSAEQASVARARVVEVISDFSNEYDAIGEYMSTRIQTLRVRILDGAYRGREAVVEYDISDPLSADGRYELDPARVGETVLIQITFEDNGTLSGYVTEFGRGNSLLWLAVAFLILLVFFGGRRGLGSIIALVTICVGLVFIMVPLMLRGVSPVWAAILGCVFSVSATLIIVYGFTTKSLAAALGAVGGLVIAGVLTSIMNAVMNMTGLLDEDWVFLALSADYDLVDLRGILFASVIIGVLGGTIDVGVSIASSLEELRDKAPEISGAQLMTSGINIGVDIMGASLNTLILSYVGGSIPIVMLCSTYNIRLVEIINKELIVNELLRALAGSYGLLLTVPLTSFVAAAIMCKGNWGRFSPDCFEIVVIAKRLRYKLREKTAVRQKTAKPVEDDDVTESLYDAAKRHREEAEQTKK